MQTLHSCGKGRFSQDKRQHAFIKTWLLEFPKSRYVCTENQALCQAGRPGIDKDAQANNVKEKAKGGLAQPVLDCAECAGWSMVIGHLGVRVLRHAEGSTEGE